MSRHRRRKHNIKALEPKVDTPCQATPCLEDMPSDFRRIVYSLSAWAQRRGVPESRADECAFMVTVTMARGLGLWPMICSEALGKAEAVYD